ncbi:uncharacterized protein LOC117514901 [Thalassophryne amazonica]|uniref:uncharacterized protein LOC117514901 n=1 Tax=Thalassophryne amazonica TaxID=390379 RepID=UPI001471AF90|nr:uncharacterized protein LOC117514901 [Thalassophryne amazonica]
MWRWQSLSHFTPEGSPPSFPTSHETEFWITLENSRTRPAKLVLWPQEAHACLDSQMDQLKSRNTLLHCSSTPVLLLDTKHTNTFSWDKAAAECKENQQHEDLCEKVRQLEKDMIDMKSTLGGSDVQPVLTESSPNPLCRTSPESGENFKRQNLKADTDLSKLREALTEIETCAKTQEERKSRRLQTSSDAGQKAQSEGKRNKLNQVEEINQRFSQTLQNHSVVQEQLLETKKMSQNCLVSFLSPTQYFIRI